MPFLWLVEVRRVKYSFCEDKQCISPISHCSHCRSEIYAEDDCYIVMGQVVCSDCLEDFEKETRCAMKGFELDTYLHHLYGGLDDIE